jgi:hypothetical protein
MHKEDEEEDEEVTNLLPAKAFEILSTISRHHQMNNYELNAKWIQTTFISIRGAAANRIIIILSPHPLIQNLLLEYKTHTHTQPV